MAGQPMQMAGQSMHMAGQPMQMAGQPIQMAGQPMQMAGQPMQMAGQPIQMAGQEVQITGQQPGVATFAVPFGTSVNVSMSPAAAQPVGTSTVQTAQASTVQTVASPQPMHTVATSPHFATQEPQAHPVFTIPPNVPQYGPCQPMQVQGIAGAMGGIPSQMQAFQSLHAFQQPQTNFQCVGSPFGGMIPREFGRNSFDQFSMLPNLSGNLGGDVVAWEIRRTSGGSKGSRGSRTSKGSAKYKKPTYSSVASSYGTSYDEKNSYDVSYTSGSNSYESSSKPKKRGRKSVSATSGSGFYSSA
eukprot:GHVP01058650.1.p1 GENE.GHVP01058650.1~~GHVP01058650.1.p1  ORF type:complete len:300 (-),score=41.47 GHVP01058650.1:672-1571(-)